MATRAPAAVKKGEAVSHFRRLNEYFLERGTTPDTARTLARNLVSRFQVARHAGRTTLAAKIVSVDYAAITFWRFENGEISWR